MRFIICLECEDIITLPSQIDSVKKCSCQKTKIVKIAENKFYYTNDNAMPAGFVTEELVNAIKNRKDKGTSSHFSAFISPKQTPMFNKVNDNLIP